MTEKTKLRVLEKIYHPDGWCIVPIHYSHDPSKTGEWSAKARAAYARAEDFEQEMELDFTAQLGAPAYPAFSQKLHIRESIPVSPEIPLCLACDFNVEPCIFEVCQIRGGKLFIIKEIVLSPGDIPGMIREFRNEFPAHAAGVYIYGDSNGLRRTSQTQKSDYDLMMIHMQGYPSFVKLKVPRAHPPSKVRVDSLNNKLRGYEDKVMMYISAECVEFIKDLQQVVMRPDGKDVLKIYRADDPYRLRTHASDAVGYLVFREWPVFNEAVKIRMGNATNVPRKPMVYGNLLGEIRRD